MGSISKYPIRRGFATPLGSTKRGTGMNFALFCEHGEEVSLLLFFPGKPDPFLEVPLNPEQNKTGHIWHVLIENLPKEIEYAYKVGGPYSPEKGLLFSKENLLSDPYAKALSSSHVWGEVHDKKLTYKPKARVIPECVFDWQDVVPPNLAKEDLIIYEMHVRGFTQHSSSRVSHPGTFLGLIDKIPYLKELGINAVELLPIFEFDECENKNINPLTKETLYNYWGYSTVNFFSPMNRFAVSSEWDASIRELKLLVRELHRNNIEVILDVVYNHTAEGNENGPVLSFKGIDNPVYYMLMPNGHFLNFSGTGNTFNCNHPAVINLILDSLRYWVSEIHVDGFRFDLASILTRGPDGTPLSDPLVVQTMTNDPLLSQTKWIAEAWDAGGLYQVGSFPGDGTWGEWNGKYRDVVRRFIKGTDGKAGAFAQVLSGSQDLYGNDRNPHHSINFITAHDGYSLRDLVSYQDKHNLGNGEENRDGNNQNDSWNCGVEGPTNDPIILALRKKQMKNFLLALMVSLGTPMILMGDEYGHTRHGNNNPYCQDNELNWFLWDQMEKEKSFLHFVQGLTHFRLKYRRVFCRKEFLSLKEVDWHGHTPQNPDWSANSRFVAYTLKDLIEGHDIYIAFNAHFEPASIELPSEPNSKKWYLVVDTSLESPQDFIDNPKSRPAIKSLYQMPAYSAIVMQAF